MTTAKMKQIGFLGISGLLCNGKSTKRKLLTDLLIQPNSTHITILSADMSDVIKDAMSWDNELGKKTLECKPLMDAGDYVPDEVAIPVLEHWTSNKLLVFPHIETIFFSGFPRTRGQVIFIQDTFRIAQAVCINTTYNLSLAGFNSDERRRQQRKDDSGGEHLFKKRWNLGIKETLPALESMNGDVLYTHRSDPMLQRLKVSLGWLHGFKTKAVANQRVLRRALGKVKDPRNPTHMEALKLDGGRY